MKTLIFNLFIATITILLLTSAAVPSTVASREDGREDKMESKQEEKKRLKKAKKIFRLEKLEAKAKTAKKRAKLQKRIGKHKEDDDKVRGLIGFGLAMGAALIFIAGSILSIRSTSIISPIFMAITMIVAIIAFIFSLQGLLKDTQLRGFAGTGLGLSIAFFLLAFIIFFIFIGA